MAQMTMCVALWHDPEHKESEVDAEAGICRIGSRAPMDPCI